MPKAFYRRLKIQKNIAEFWSKLQCVFDDLHILKRRVDQKGKQIFVADIVISHFELFVSASV